MSLYYWAIWIFYRSLKTNPSSVLCSVIFFSNWWLAHSCFLQHFWWAQVCHVLFYPSFLLWLLLSSPCLRGLAYVQVLSFLHRSIFSCVMALVCSIPLLSHGNCWVTHTWTHHCYPSPPHRDHLGCARAGETRGLALDTPRCSPWNSLWLGTGTETFYGCWELVDVEGQLYTLFYAILYEGPEHSQIFVSMGVLEPISCGQK